MLLNDRNGRDDRNGPTWPLWAVALVFALICVGTLIMNLLKIEGH